MQKFIKLSAIFLLITSAIFFAACGKREDINQDKPVTSITLNAQEITLLKGDTFALVATVLPTDATNKEVKYKSQNTQRVLVDETTGLITALASTTSRGVLVHAESQDGSNKNDYITVVVVENSVDLQTPQDFVLTANRLSWTPVSGAFSYTLNINSEKIENITTPYYDITDFNILNTYSVKAVGDGYITLDSQNSTTITARILQTPQDFSNNKDTISWLPVAGAEGYELVLNEQVIQLEETSIKLDLSYPQAYNIKVRALISGANNHSSQFTQALTLTRLATPGNIKSQAGGLVWNSVEQASKYLIEVNEEEVFSITPSYQLGAEKDFGDYTFRIKAVGEAPFILDSDYSVELLTYKLESPKNLRITQGKIMWDESDFATSYSLNINGALLQIHGASEYMLGSEYLPSAYNISVAAQGNSNNYLRSNFSPTITTRKLQQTQQVVVTGGKLSWTSVPYATSYIVTLNQDTYEVTTPYFEATQGLLPGEYYAFVTAKAVGYLYSDTTLPIVVEKLSAPTNFSIREGLLSWTGVANAGGYEIVAGAHTFNAGIINHHYLDLPSGSYDIKIKTLGDNLRYLSSEYLVGQIIATKLSTPSGLGLENGYIKFNPVANAKGYNIEINGSVVYIRSEHLPYYVDGTENESYNIRVAAVGDDSSYLNSSYTQIIQANQLASVQNVKIKNAQISWDIVQNAQNYEVWIKPQEAEEYNRLTDLFLASINSYNLSSTANGQYSIKVRARGDDVQNLTSSDSIEFNFERLQTPQYVELKDGLISWSAVKNATRYLVKINDQSIMETSTTYYLLNESYEEGMYSIKVAAYGDGVSFITSEYSQDIIQGLKIGAPTNLRVEAGVLVWDEVPGAEGYSVKINEKFYPVEANSFEGKTGIPSGEQDVVVYAFSEQGFLSNPTPAIRINKLITPSNIWTEDAVVMWNAVINATSYKIIINNNPDIILPSSQNYYNLLDYQDYGVGGFAIKVMAIGDSNMLINSDYTGQIRVIVMEEPNNLRVEDGKLTWMAISGAEDYEIEVYQKVGTSYTLLNIEDPILTGNVTQYLLDNNYPAGEYGIRIRAIGDGSEYLTSAYYPTEQNGELRYFDIIKLNAPSNLRVQGGKIAYDSVANATGYEVAIKNPQGEIVYKRVGTSTLFELPAEFESKTYQISVRAIGNNTNYTSSSLASFIEAQKLEKVKDFRVENGLLVWSPNSNASGYILDISGQEYEIGLVTSYDLPYTASYYFVKIKAKGTNLSYLNSNFVEDALSVTKLAGAKNLGVKNGVLSWDRVSVAPDGYTLIIINAAHQETKIPLSQATTQYIFGPSFMAGYYNIWLQTNGDSLANINSVRVGSPESGPLQVQKLATVTGVSLSLIEEGVNFYYRIDWAATQGAVGYRLIIKDQYEQEIVNAVVEDTNYPLQEYFESGMYFASVQALGDSATKLNGDASASMTITKPSMPTNLLVANGVVTWAASEYATEYIVELTYGDLEEVYERLVIGSTRYYLSDLGQYSIRVRASYSGSLMSDYTEAFTYYFDLFQSGNGTQETPFVVLNEQELNNVKYNPTAYYILQGNINLSSQNFVPIGTQSLPFIGNFDGAHYTVNNLNISVSYDYAGMFGYIGAQGVVKNLIFTNANITSPARYSAIVAGYNTGTINNVRAQGLVNPIRHDANISLYAGGVAGYNKGNITNTISSALVTPTNDSSLVYAGGIAGENKGLIYRSGVQESAYVSGNISGGVAGYNAGEIRESYNKGAVSAYSTSGAHSYAGGIAGYNQNREGENGNRALIESSYNQGVISAVTNHSSSLAYAGGLAGYNGRQSATYYGLITNSYSTGLVQASSNNGASVYAGGLTAWNDNKNNLRYNYYLNSSAGQVTFGDGYTNAQGASPNRDDTFMKGSGFVTLLNNEKPEQTTSWVVNSGGYPKLGWEA